MKYLIIVLFSSFLLLSTAQADLIGVLDLSGRDNAGLGAGESAGNFASPKTFDEVSDLDLNDVAWSDEGFSGVVDISLDATTSGVGDLIARGGKGAFGINVGGTQTGGSRAVIGAGDGTITLSNIQFTYVSGDPLANIASIQFSAVYIGNYTVATETGTLNGEAITTGNNGGDLAAGRNDLITFADSVVVDSTVGTFSINGVDLAVTAIPEPSVAVLFGLGSLGLIAWRRRYA